MSQHHGGSHFGAVQTVLPVSEGATANSSASAQMWQPPDEGQGQALVLTWLAESCHCLDMPKDTLCQASGAPSLLPGG